MEKSTRTLSPSILALSLVHMPGIPRGYWKVRMGLRVACVTEEGTGKRAAWGCGKSQVVDTIGDVREYLASAGSIQKIMLRAALQDVDAQGLNLDVIQAADRVLEGRRHVGLAMPAREKVKDAPDGDRSGGVPDTGLARYAPVDPPCLIPPRPRLPLRAAVSLHRAGGGRP